MKFFDEKSIQTTCNILDPESIERNEIKKLLADSYIKQFNTFIDIHTIEKKNLFITDIDQLTKYKENLKFKLILNSIIFSLILIIQSVVHLFLSYQSFKFCQSKINEVNYY